MAPVLTLHEVPAVVSIGSQRPAPQIGLQRTSAIERGIGVGIVLAVIKETVDAAIDGCRQFLWYDFPLIIAIDIEEVTLIVGVVLRLIEMVVLADVLLHIAMRIQTVVAL